MKYLANIFLFINFFNSIFSVVPTWNFYNSAIDLLNSGRTHDYSVNKDNWEIKKSILKEDNSIKYEKYLYYVGSYKGEFDFENLDHYYTSILGASNLVCPRGKYHPYDIDNKLNKTNNFEERRDWDLKCFNHQSGYFLMFYLHNKEKHLYYSFNNEEIKSAEGYFETELYDFLLEDGSNVHNYQYKLAFIYSNNNYLNLQTGGLIMNSADKKVDKANYDSPLNLLEIKNYSQAYFTEDYNFHYFSYNNVSDFLGGYSNSGISSTDYADKSRVTIINHSISPIEFLDEVEINKINFIPGTKYAYYEIYNKNTLKTNYGFMDIKNNKVLFNTDETITTFVPYSNTELLAITPNSAYKICIYKDSNNNQCLETCPSGNLILDIDGNKCKSNYECDEGKIKLIPNDICINNSLCDLNIFIKNSSHCGLCKELYPETPIKLLNTFGCTSNIPSNSIPYNSNSYLNIYKCKPLFHPYDNETCVPDFCFQNCLECYEASNDTNNQKCLSCKEGYYMDNENCIKCSNIKCQTCTKESNEINLCTKCLRQYLTVNLTTKNPKYFYCFEKNEIPNKFFKENNTNVYKPCYRKCKKCNKEGNDKENNCLECNPGFMPRPIYNPKNNCIGESKYLSYDAYNNIKNLKNEQCPEEAKYRIKGNETYKVLCIYNCSGSKDHLYLYNGNCLESCPVNTTNISFVCRVNKEKCSLGENDIYLEGNGSMSVIQTLAKTYISEFHYTHNHISRYYNQNFSIILYKNSDCIREQNMRMPTIDFKNCSEVVKKFYNATELVAAVADKKAKYNPTTMFMGFYHPKTGIKLETDILCNDTSVEIKENLLALLDENDENYFLQIYLSKQGINIFDENDEFFTNICLEFDNPLSRDIPLKDRLRSVFPDAKLCDDGCTNEGIDMVNLTAICSCKFKDISKNNIENILFDEYFGKAIELIEASNFEVLRCHKNFFKNFGKSIGGILSILLIVSDITFSILFIFFELTKLKNYILSLTDKYLLFLKQSEHKRGNNPPKKNIDDITHSRVKFMKNRNLNKKVMLAETNKKTKSITVSKENVLIFKTKGNIERKNDTNKKTEVKKNYSKDYKKNKIFFEEYLSPSLDDMAFDDALVMDERNFLETFCEILKEKQMIMNSFFACDPLKTRFIKLILFILDICLYFVVNGLFFGEEYLSLLFNLKEEDIFLVSFQGQSIN